jgi:hypothetical protein
LQARSTFNGFSFEITAMANSQSAFRNLKSLIRPLVRDLHSYVPGGQLQVDFDAVMS